MKILTVAFVLMFLSMAPIVAHGSSPLSLMTVRILSDGSIEPSNGPIQRNGDVYTFTDNVYAQIVVDRDNIVIDGAGYALRGTYNGTRTDSWVVGDGPYQEYNETAFPWTIGIDLANENRHNLTVQNLNIRNFYIGMYVWTSNNTVSGCSISDNIVGILLSGDSNNIIRNYLARNEEGVFFGVNQPGNTPLSIVLSRNSFVDNVVHFSGCFCEEYNTSEPIHTWDDGEQGNYWSNYNGTDADGNGVGDATYVIDVQNQDRYPLMQSVAAPPVPTPKIPFETIIVAIALSISITVVAVVACRKRKHTPKA
jgi:parallel beta-helix repeat protein